MPGSNSLAASLASLPASARTEVLSSLSEEQARALLYDWRTWARPAQLEPAGDWSTWLVLAGRGFGKTLTAAQWVRAQVEGGQCGRLALVAPTSADARDVMVEGESGILAVCPPWNKPRYESSKRRVVWPNGAMATLYSAEEPDRLNGPQHDGASCDELAVWPSVAAWDMLMFGLRLGARPRAVVTTTPKMNPATRPLIKALLEAPTTATTRGSSYDNRANLALSFFAEIIRKYEGTQLGRQELLAELLEDQEGALWQRGPMIEQQRRTTYPALVRICVAVDPAASSTGAETGIVVAGRGDDGHGYVLDDRSVRGSPDTWATAAVAAYHTHKADALVAEANNGGEMVAQTIKTAQGAPPTKLIHASRGKQTRAEPVARLYEQGKVHHVGAFPALEDQLCVAAGTLVATVAGERAIEHLGRGDLVLTRSGYRPVLWAGLTGSRWTLTVRTECGTLRCTPNHPIYVAGRGFIPAAEVQTADRIQVCLFHPFETALSLRASATTATTTATTRRVARAGVACTTVRYGPASTVPSHRATTSIIATAIPPITTLPTSSRLAPRSTRPPMGAAGHGRSRSTPEATSGVRNGPCACRTRSAVPVVAWNSNRPARAPRFVLSHAAVVGIERTAGTEPEPVFNLSVDGAPEFFANGLLTHNCSWVPGGTSPDRLDALVWALTELLVDAPGPARITWG